MIYIVLFFILCILSICFKKIKTTPIVSAIIIGSILSIVIGVRADNIGNDTDTYIQFFYEAQNYNNFFENNSNHEIGYVLLMRVIGLVTNNHHVMFIILAFVTIIPIMYIIFKYSNEPWLSVFLIFGLQLFTFFMSGMRGSLALMMCFIALPFLFRKKIIKYVCIILLATLFHKTALFALLFIPLYYIQLKSWVVIVGLFLSFIIMFFMDPIMNLIIQIFPKYAGYVGSTYFDGTGRIGSILRLFTTLAVGLIFLLCKNPIIYNNTPKINTKNMDKKLNLYNWSYLLVVLLQIVSLSANIVSRLVQYVYMIWLLAMPKVSTDILDESKKMLFNLGVVVIFVTYFIIVQIFRPEWNHILPYEIFF